MTTYTGVFNARDLITHNLQFGENAGEFSIVRPPTLLTSPNKSPVGLPQKTTTAINKKTLTSDWLEQIDVNIRGSLPYFPPYGKRYKVGG